MQRAAQRVVVKARQEARMVATEEASPRTRHLAMALSRSPHGSTTRTADR